MLARLLPAVLFVSLFAAAGCALDDEAPEIDELDLEAKGGGRGCKNVRCDPGSHCEVSVDGPICVADDPCTGVVCEANWHCEVSADAPTCVPDAGWCSIIRCPIDYHCVEIDGGATCVL